MRYLYKITNLINGKCYIGQTNDFKRRVRTHKYGPTQSVIHLAIVKYGKENFKFEILDQYIDEAIDGAEVEAIKQYNTLAPHGYNLETGGCLYKRHSKESLLKMSKSQKGHKVTEETRRKLSITKTGKTQNITPERHLELSLLHKNKKHSQETKDKIRNANKGKVRSKEYKDKISNSQKLRHAKIKLAKKI